MIIQLQRSSTIILIGDKGIDIYQFGQVNRLSPEAPVPVFVPTRQETKPGMAANVESNLKALGLSVVTYSGGDSIKSRLIDTRTKQHIVRIDEDVGGDPLTIDQITNLNCQAVVVSDYNKGYVTYELVEELRKKYTGPIFIDTKKTDLARFEGCIIKINSHEQQRVSSFPSSGTDLIVTHGDQGAVWNGKCFSAEKVEVADVCGAGDTFLAALVFQYLKNKKMDEAIRFAIRASAVTVQHIGVYAPTLKEII